MNRHRYSAAELLDFGRLLRDLRSAAGMSRVGLARRAGCSDATIKFIETARHPPSRATLIRLVNVTELKLDWAQTPGGPPPLTSTEADSRRRLSAAGYEHVDITMRLMACAVEPGDVIGCRQGRELYQMLARLLELPPRGDRAGAIAALKWLLGNGPAPLLAGLVSRSEAGGLSDVAWLAELGAAALDRTGSIMIGDQLRGVALALAWVRCPQAVEPAGLCLAAEAS